jgi:uncharacterized protein (DUF885 family)
MDTLEQRRAELRAALAEQWEYELRESPEFATMIGDYRYNDRWSDLSLAHIYEEKRDLAAWLARFEAIGTGGFSEQESLSHSLMVRKLREELEGFEFKEFEMPVDQLDGLHILLPQFVTLMPFATVKHYEDYLGRLQALPTTLGQIVDLLRQGERDGLMPPRYLLEKTVGQCRNIAGPTGEENVFGRPVARMPEELAPAESERLRAEILAVIDQQVRPAYSRLAEFIAADYAPKGRTEMGVWSLPDGEARYRFAVRHLTTTDMDPEEIHQLGLEEVARVEAEQAGIARRLGFPDLAACRAALQTDRNLFATSRDQLLELQRGYIQQMEKKLPSLFGLLPGVPLEVRPVQAFREKEAAPAEYYPGTPDGRRPGVVYVNTCDYEQRSLAGIESTAYHEGVPGHHLQLSIAQTLPQLPAFRQHAHFGAYIEGWALYAECLGKEVGFYQDPHSDFGRLSNELLRATRLVLDTGVHWKRWSREQMVDYFRAHSSEDEPDLQAEVDRYIVLPAQALTYKLGELEIVRLRERARAALGARYDVRTFHDKILDGGALPLDVLAERIGGWIEGQIRAGEAGAAPSGAGGEERS